MPYLVCHMILPCRSQRRVCFVSLADCLMLLGPYERYGRPIAWEQESGFWPGAIQHDLSNWTFDFWESGWWLKWWLWDNWAIQLTLHWSLYWLCLWPNALKEGDLIDGVFWSLLLLFGLGCLVYWWLWFQKECNPSWCGKYGVQNMKLLLTLDQPGRKRWSLRLSLFFPFFLFPSVQGPDSRDGVTHIQGGFSLCS